MFRQWCSLSMLHRTCENIHGSVGLGGLSKLNRWYTLCMPIYFEPWGIKKYSVPYMVQNEHTYILIKCGIVNPYVDGFLNSSGNTMVLPPYYLEVVLCENMACYATVIVYRGGFHQVFFESVSKGPGGLLYIPHHTKVLHIGTNRWPTFVFHGVLVLGGNQDVFSGTIALKVGLYAICAACTSS